MANFFRHPDRRQRFLVPIDMIDWLPENDIVHVIVDSVGVMDLRRFKEYYSTSGPDRPRSRRR
jgi:transposase